MAKKVTMHVHAHHKSDGSTKVLEPGDEVPTNYVVGEHAFEEVEEPTHVTVPGFGQVSVHELKRLQMRENGGQTDEEKAAEKVADDRRKAQAAAARKRAEAASSAAQGGTGSSTPPQGAAETEGDKDKS